MKDEKMLRVRDTQYRLSYGAVVLPSSEWRIVDLAFAKLISLIIRALLRTYRVGTYF